MTGVLSGVRPLAVLRVVVDGGHAHVIEWLTDESGLVYRGGLIFRFFFQAEDGIRGGDL